MRQLVFYLWLVNSDKRCKTYVYSSTDICIARSKPWSLDNDPCIRTCIANMARDGDAIEQEAALEAWPCEKRHRGRWRETFATSRQGKVQSLSCTNSHLAAHNVMAHSSAVHTLTTLAANTKPELRIVTSHSTMSHDRVTGRQDRRVGFKLPTGGMRASDRACWRHHDFHHHHNSCL